ncbi:MAG: hypothetical protein ACRCX2_24910 [Paraclostridium sp.]
MNNSKPLNRISYNDKENCVRILNKYYEDFSDIDNTLTDPQKFELFIMYLSVRHQYVNINLKEALKVVYCLDYDDVEEWLNSELASRYKARIVSAGYRFINTLIKKEGTNLTEKELCSLEYVLDVLR